MAQLLVLESPKSKLCFNDGLPIIICVVVMSMSHKTIYIGHEPQIGIHGQWVMNHRSVYCCVHRYCDHVSKDNIFRLDIAFVAWEEEEIMTGIWVMACFFFFSW